MIIAYNKPITFGRHGTAKDLQCTGIDFSEDGNHSWTKAPVAEFAIQLPVARQEVLLQLDAAPFIIPESVTAQKVFVFVGGLFTGYCSFTEPEVRALPLNRNALSGRALQLSLVIPTATSPASLRISDDERELGICLTSIIFRSGPE
jgi:hypothetical protein